MNSFQSSCQTKKILLLIINFNNVNKYSYSYFGIEFPEIKYKQISDYNIERKIRVQQKDFTLFIKDYETNFYYIFDLTQDLNNKKLPYIEIPFNTLLFTNIIGYINNYFRNQRMPEICVKVNIEHTYTNHLSEEERHRRYKIMKNG